MRINNARLDFCHEERNYLYRSEGKLKIKHISHSLRKVRVAYEYLFDDGHIILFLGNGKRTGEVFIRYRTRNGLFRWVHGTCKVSGRLNPHNTLLAIIVDCVCCKTTETPRWYPVTQIPIHFLDKALTGLTQLLDPASSFGLSAPSMRETTPIETSELLPDGSILLDKTLIENFGPGSSICQGIFNHIRGLRRVKGK